MTKGLGKIEGKEAGPRKLPISGRWQPTKVSEKEVFTQL